jgi:hypothetical protein
MKSYNILAYNSSFKIAENFITIKKYEKTQLCGYVAKNHFSSDGKKIKVDKITLERQKKERFIKSCYRAKEKIFDLIVCNANKHLDYENKKQNVKFLTLTFKEKISEIEKANKELTKFMKRLSFYCYGTRKNVIKYIAVPELQKRGAWHFHVILFNVKYVEWAKLMRLWGNGGVYINAIKVERNDDIKQVAKYITKYISKSMCIEKTKNEKKAKIAENYELYKKYGMENKKRYSCSKGLYRPFLGKIEISNAELELILDYLITIGQAKNEDIYFNEYENEYRGKVQIINIEIKQKKAADELKKHLYVLKQSNINFYRKEYKINWEKIKKRREKYIEEEIIYNLEERLESQFYVANAKGNVI